jgi:1-phosphatidylinositol phosphodiesterase
MNKSIVTTIILINSIQVLSDIICIKNRKHNEYIYAAGDQFAFDNDRRRVFTWIPGSQVIEGKWDLKHIGNQQYTLRNTQTNEYLYTSSYKENRPSWPASLTGSASFPHYVFTWRPKSIVMEGTWLLKKRDKFYEIINVYHDTILSVGTNRYDKDRRLVYSIDGRKSSATDEAQHWQITRC